MSLLKRNDAGINTFRNMLSDFFENEELAFERLWKKEWTPAANVVETDKSYDMELAAPGFTKNDFKVKVEKGILTISAEKKEEKEEKNKNYTRKEYSFNSFTRSFTLPEDAKDEDIRAQYENGVLKVSIGKKQLSPASNPKEIAVN